MAPFVLGAIGVLYEIPFCVTSDLLPTSLIDPLGILRRYVTRRRSTRHRDVGYGEEILEFGKSLALATRSKVRDITSDPNTILEDICRVLKPRGLSFLDVGTFSVLGLV